MVKITDVIPGSIAEEIDLHPGDTLVAINRQPLHDLVDYVRVTRNAEELHLDVRCSDGSCWEMELEKDAEDDLGVILEHPEPMQCGNSCQFCFVHQLPAGMRRSLYIKDEDYRFSYLYGAYVTLSNVREEEVERIIRDRLSPLYISVHATDETVRAELLGRQQIPPILPMLERLVAAGIELHTQIVLCPQINDGTVLEKTIDDLANLAPGILSLALVPVGLTAHRNRLPRLRLQTADEAERILAVVRRWQKTMLERHKRRFVFAADEFYLRAGAAFPPLADYEDLPQFENGVGMIPLFRHDAEEVLRQPLSNFAGLTADLITGEAFAPELTDFVQRLNDKAGTRLVVHAVRNQFFAGGVSVAGLLTGYDIEASVRHRLSSRILLLPDVLFRDGEDVFLDDMTPEQLGKSLDIDIFPVAANPWGIYHALAALSLEAEEKGIRHG